MDNRFLAHNAHLIDAKRFSQVDPQLSRLNQQEYIYNSPVITQLPTNVPGVYTLSGGRQIGKTTLLKQWMQHLLQIGIQPKAIAFFSGELIDDHHTLFRLLQNQLSLMPNDCINYILLDEVTYIKNWDKAIKFAVDSGLLINVELFITGSDLVILKEARMCFPGRRGTANEVDFHLYPLTFREVVELKKIPQDINFLFNEFSNYLIHGGYLAAINDFALHGSISLSTLNTYSDWIRGDVLRRGKQELYLHEILVALIKRYGSQITWNSLSQDLSVDHHKTVSDYIELLVSMDVLFVQYALLEDKLSPAMKKARKVIFTDPFIFHAIRAWLLPNANPYQNQIAVAVADPELSSQLVEACVASHYRRFYSTYYIKAEGEVDIAFIKENKFWPVEVKWTNQIRPKDLKQVTKYRNSCILTKTRESGEILHVKTKPLPLALMEF